ncbi:MAG: hypothetical protein ACSHX6_14195 [Akkermansiaceae bacterium]
MTNINSFRTNVSYITITILLLVFVSCSDDSNEAEMKNDSSASQSSQATSPTDPKLSATGKKAADRIELVDQLSHELKSLSEEFNANSNKLLEHAQLMEDTAAKLKSSNSLTPEENKVLIDQIIKARELQAVSKVLNAKLAVVKKSLEEAENKTN